MKSLALLPPASLLLPAFALAAERPAVSLIGPASSVLAGARGLVRPATPTGLTEIPDQCKDELRELGQNTQLMDAARAAGEGCPVSSSGDTVEVDYGSCPNVGNLQIACTAAGGQFTTVPSLNVTCTANGQKVAMLISNYPDCVGESCDGSVVLDEEGKKALSKEFEKQIGSQGILDAKCSIETDSSVPRPGRIMPVPPGPAPAPPGPAPSTSPASATIPNTFAMAAGVLAILSSLV